MIIYKLTNKINGLVYIGATTKILEERFTTHKYTSRYRRSKLYDAFNKYGVENFIPEMIMICNNTQELNDMEIYYIKEYNSIENGYNGCVGGLELNAKGAIHTEEWKKENSKRLKGNTNGFQKGRPSSFKGKKHKDESRKKISEVQIGRKASDKTKIKMSKSQLNRTIKKYKCIDPSGNEFFTGDKIVSLSQFCIEKNLVPSLMAAVARGERKHHKNWKCIDIT